jgi:hypothetical protein
MRLKRVLAALLTPFMMMLNCPVMAAEEGDTTTVKLNTEVFHKPIESAEAGKRIALYTEVSDPKGIDVVRVYFKSKDAADYSFIALKQVENQEKSLFEKFQNLGSDFKGQGYSGVLPAPANGSKSFEYLVLVKNTANSVVKSQTYEVPVTDGAGGTIDASESVQVYTELSEAPKTVTGFSDNITIDLVESGAKFGAVAGLYSGLSGIGGGAISGGTVAASSGAFTTTAVVVGSVATAAVVGGIAAVAGGGSSSGGSSNAIGNNTSASALVGTYTITDTRSSWSGRATLNSGGGGSLTEYINGRTYYYSITWSYTTSSRYLNVRTTTGGGVRGTIRGTTTDFYIDGNYANGKQTTFHCKR